MSELGCCFSVGIILMWGTVRDCPIYPSRIVQIHAHGQGGCMEHGWYIIPWSQKQARTAASSNNFESATIIGFRDPGCNLPRFQNCFDQRWLNGLCIQTLFSYRSSVCSVWRIGGMEKRQLGTTFLFVCLYFGFNVSPQPLDMGFTPVIFIS